MVNSKTGLKNHKRSRPIHVIAIVMLDFLGGGGGEDCPASTCLPIWKPLPVCEILVENNAFPPTTEARRSKSYLCPHLSL